MDVIKITPEELRITADELRTTARLLLEPFPLDAYPGEGALLRAEAYRAAADKFSALADKLEADKREALEFIPAKGVQA
ncbi:hypothetical protein [Alcanivorax sp.]|uniref:hypothetical protein n=1 Tax=Alcanivorax sp. TaxID=1872427 RepID=UPI0025BB0963|nr:hypothetical protein [Alcanivorax sp.]